MHQACNQKRPTWHRNVYRFYHEADLGDLFVLVCSPLRTYYFKGIVPPKIKLMSIGCPPRLWNVGSVRAPFDASWKREGRGESLAVTSLVAPAGRQREGKGSAHGLCLFCRCAWKGCPSCLLFTFLCCSSTSVCNMSKDYYIAMKMPLSSAVYGCVNLVSKAATFSSVFPRDEELHKKCALFCRCKEFSPTSNLTITTSRCL